MTENENVVGTVWFNNSNINSFYILTSKKNTPKKGEFITVKNLDDELVLCTIKNGVAMASPIIDSIQTPDNVDAFRKTTPNILIDKWDGIVLEAKVIGVVNDEGVISENLKPIGYGESVSLASDELLEKLFSKGHISIGCLRLRESVRVKLDIKMLCSRHFSILAVTGGGKSNTVAILVEKLYEEIVKPGELNVLIVDPHGEYASLKSNKHSNMTNLIEAKIDPSKMQPDEFGDVLKILDNANKQRMYLRYAMETIHYEHPEASGCEYLELLINQIRGWLAVFNGEKEEWVLSYYDGWGYSRRKLERDDEKSLIRILDQLITFKKKYLKNNMIGDYTTISNLKSQKLNILNLSGMDIQDARIIVGQLLKTIYNDRVEITKYYRTRTSTTKPILQVKCLEKPILVIIEEAHSFALKGDSNPTSYWLEKIAREGRKFGVGMGIISQRPKELNSTILSQTNTKIILKIVEPNDQRYVQESSENISNDLLKDMPRLSTGEAVIVGSSLQIPATVKINKYNGKLGGVDGFECLKNI